MPWYQTKDIHVQWTEWQNDVHYLSITPHQASSKVVVQRRTLRKASLIRRGIAAEFEQDFIKTAMGRTSFMASLGQMARAVQETANVEDLRALVACHTYNYILHRKNGILKDEDLEGYWDRRVNRFMCVQKDKRGLATLDVEIADEQDAYQAEANVWILDRRLMDYTRIVNPLYSEFQYGGERAVSRFLGAPEGAPAAGGTMESVKSLQPQNFVNQTPVFLAKSYHVEGTGRADFLSREVEVGVFNLLADRCKDHSRYITRERAIQVYNNDRDAWDEISLEEAIQNNIIFDSNGAVKRIIGTNFRLSDPDNDWLSYQDYSPGGGRVEIDYIGDISKNFLPVSYLEKAGLTVFNALNYGDDQMKRKMMEDSERHISVLRNAASAPEDVAAANQFFANLTDQLKTLLGNDNMFFKRGAFNFVKNFVRLDMNPLIPIQAQIGEQAEMRISSEIQGFLGRTLGAALVEETPDKYRNAFDQVVSREADDWKARAQEIRKIILDARKEDKTFVNKNLKDVATVDVWFNGLVEQLQTKLDTIRDRAAAVDVNAEMRYIPIGAPVPQGFRHAHPERANATKTLLRMPAFADFVASHMSGGGQRMPPGARQPFSRALNRQQEQERRQNAPGSVSAANAATWDSVVGVAERQRYNIAHFADEIAKGALPRLIKYLSILYAGSTFTRERLLSFCRSNIAVACNVLCVRHACAYRTKIGIKCKEAGGSGYTFFGNSDMQLEFEAARKVGMMHYTCYLSAVVIFPKNVYVVEDMFCEKYLGGMGVSFWPSADEYKSGRMPRNAYSIIAIAVPINQNRLEKRIDIRGRWYTEQKMGLVSKQKFDTPCFFGYERSSYLLGLHDANKADKVGSRGRRRINFMCSQAVEFYWNTKSDRYDSFTPEASHFGSYVYPTCGLVRNGHFGYLERPAYLSSN